MVSKIKKRKSIAKEQDMVFAGILAGAAVGAFLAVLGFLMFDLSVWAAIGVYIGVGSTLSMLLTVALYFLLPHGEQSKTIEHARAETGERETAQEEFAA